MGDMKLSGEQGEQAFYHRAWARAYSQGRENIEVRDWHTASLEYCQAFEAAEQMLRSRGDAYDIERYIRTSLELIFCLRMSSTNSDLTALIHIVEFNLGTYLSDTQLLQRLTPLYDVAFAALNSVQHWVDQLFLAEQKKANTLH